MVKYFSRDLIKNSLGSYRILVVLVGGRVVGKDELMPWFKNEWTFRESRVCNMLISLAHLSLCLDLELRF